MIYAVINILFVIFLSWLAIFTDRKTGSEGTSPVVYLNLILDAACGIMAVAILLSNSGAPERLSFFLCEMVYFLMGIYVVQLSIYYVLYPSVERGLIPTAVNWGALIWCIWIIFFHFTGITITNFIGMRVESKSLFLGNLANLFPYSYFEFYQAIVFYTVPFFAVLIMLLRSENRESKLDHEKAMLNSISIILIWVGMAIIKRASIRVPMFSTLVLLPFVFAQWILVRSVLINFLYDILSTFGFFIQLFAGYIVPAIFVGVMFAVLWPIYTTSPRIFYFDLILVIVLTVTLSYLFTKFLNKRFSFRTQQYAVSFESDLSEFDFSDDPENIVHNMQDIFNKNIGMSFLRILIENGNEEIESVYDGENEKHICVPLKGKMFDTLLNQNRRIVFRNDVATSYHYSAIRNELATFFKTTSADAFIILNEGRRILGVLVLGPKVGGNIYSDYDFDVFTKLYSYFFVLGYYMKNIGNQEIVGTVNREIRMSEQIIESIQGNMDPIKNKRFDSGTLMTHAHNIGGEFIDLVRLSEDRHIFVMGDLSGKGIAASMSMVIVKSVIRTFLQETKDFKLLVEKVNQFIRFNLPKGTFFEGVFGLIDFNENTVYYINCAVPALLLYNRSYNNVMEIQGEGHVLGFVKDISPYLKVKKIKLNPGDIMVAVTDGILDSKSLRGEAYGKERIQKSIAENTNLPASNIVESIFQGLKNFLSKELDDDVSIFVLKLLK